MPHRIFRLVLRQPPCEQAQQLVRFTQCSTNGPTSFLGTAYARAYKTIRGAATRKSFSTTQREVLPLSGFEPLSPLKAKVRFGVVLPGPNARLLVGSRPIKAFIEAEIDAWTRIVARKLEPA